MSRLGNTIRLINHVTTNSFEITIKILYFSQFLLSKMYSIILAIMLKYKI